MAPPEDLLGRHGGRAREDRRATPRSVTAGFVLVAGIFAVLVAVSHPTWTVLALAIGAGAYARRELVRRTAYERTLQLCGPRFCLQFQLRVG